MYTEYWKQNLSIRIQTEYTKKRKFSVRQGSFFLQFTNGKTLLTDSGREYTNAVSVILPITYTVFRFEILITGKMRSKT